MFCKYLFAGIALIAAVPLQPAAANTGQGATEAAVGVPAATLAAYAGTYTSDRGLDVVIALGIDGALTIQINGPPLKMRPVSQTEFAVDEKRARVAFAIAEGKVSGLTIRMGPRELHATRVQ